MNRRELMTAAGALALAGCGDQPGAAPQGAVSITPSADPFTGDRLMRDVEAYVGFGTHRSGSKGDLATTDWLAAHWKGLGYTVEQTEFPTPNADTTLARLASGTETLDGFAQPPLSFTPDAGVTAPLAAWNPNSLANVSGRIAYVHIPRAAGAIAPSAAYRDTFERCAKAGALGVVAVMSGPTGEVVAINTPVEMALDIPVLQVGEKEKPRVDALLAGGQPVTLTITGPGGFRNCKNTIARRGDKGPWVIISTPQSGWFTCGGERGPGIAISRALSEWAVSQTFPVRWLFIATSGHEWTDYGAHLFHESLAPDPKDTAFWFHLGASFGARAYQETPAGLVALDTPNLTRTLMATADMVPICRAAFKGQPVIEDPHTTDVSKALGEYRMVAAEGYSPSAGFWGANAHFHTPSDGADSTTAAIMQPVARAIAAVLETRLRAL